MSVPPAERPEPLGIIGYRLNEKFNGLDFLGTHVDDYDFTREAGFYERLRTFRGLVLFHGYFNQALKFINTCGDYLLRHQFIVLFFSTESLVSTVEECKKISPLPAARDCEKVTKRTDLLPYMHLLTYKVSSPVSQQIRQQFKSLVDAFGNLDALTDKEKIIGLWNIIDPESEKEADKKLMTRMKELERVIIAGPLDANSPAEHFEIVRAHYGGQLPDYATIRRDYLAACRAFRLKKKLSRWQTERESLNHKDFQHYFYDLIARPSVVKALDSFSSGQCPALPASVISVLGKWAKLKDAFLALFLRANPEAVASCELNLAILTPHHPSSAAIIQQYKDAYGDAIDLKVKVAKDLLEKVDRVVRSLLGREAGCEGELPAGAPNALGTELSARCKAFSAHVSSLRLLADLEDEGGE